MRQPCLAQKGVTLVELVVTVSILALLASVVLPLSWMAGQRTRELELKRNLRVIRTAIDDYKRAYDKAVQEKKIVAVANKTGYPKDLEMLVAGDDFGGVYSYKQRFLRRIPPDPMNPPRGGQEPKWGLRSYTDSPDSPVWGREDVFDIYSESEGVAIDGSRYKDW
jgi:general secretion pathway protein G